MNPFTEARATTRVLLRPAMNWAAAAFVTVLVVVGITAGAVYLANKGTIDKYSNEPAKTVPTKTYVASMVNLLSCLGKGPSNCADYASSKAALRQITPPGGFSYPDVRGKQHHFTYAPDVSDSTLRAVGAAVGGSNGQAVTPGQITSSASNNQTGEYVVQVDGQTVTMRMTLSISDRDAELINVSRAP